MIYSVYRERRYKTRPPMNICLLLYTQGALNTPSHYLGDMRRQWQNIYPEPDSLERVHNDHPESQYMRHPPLSTDHIPYTHVTGRSSDLESLDTRHLQQSTCPLPYTLYS